jgi:hypothetical protein
MPPDYDHLMGIWNVHIMALIDALETIHPELFKYSKLGDASWLGNMLSDIEYVEGLSVME